VKMFGGDGPPKAPEWLLEDRVPGKKTKAGFEVPMWLTYEKWQTFTAPNRARSVRWWTQAHDENGNPAFDKQSTYTVAQAVDLLLAMNARAPLEFDPTLEVSMVMNLDPKFPDQQIRCSVALPHGTGKDMKVAVFCGAEEEEEVLALGAYKAGAKLADEIAEEQIDFDVLLAKPQMMPRLAKLGKILGPRRLMPSPKSGTVVQDYAQAIKDFSGGTIELRNDRRSLVNCRGGKLSMGREKLIENFRAIMTGLVEKRPAGAKSKLWDRVFMGSTMSPTLRIAETEYPKVPGVDDD